MKSALATLMILVLAALPLAAQDEPEAAAEKKADKKESRIGNSTFSAFKLRGIGPALMSGRIADIAIDPTDQSHWYLAVASGGVWETRNAGTTWKPIFDGQGSYSIGCVTVDPRNPLVVWVGTGENNSQRSVGFGDGLYKSRDGGANWKKVGLESSEHIARILVDPRDSDVVYVAAQGPLWAPGGERGLYKTTDGGKSWSCVLEIDENTGVTDVHFDPRNPDVLYAASYQRRRHVWTLIDGGPGSAIHKSTDAGATWKKLSKGLPGGDVGRIGMAISPQQPDVLYAIIEASGSASGFYRSANGGESWRKMSSYISTSPQYYQELFCDPWNFDRVYSLDTRTQVTDDGGKTWSRVPGAHKHVDDHALAFDPRDPEYLLIGSDGGLYESFDRGANWAFKANLPVTQFYKLCVDEDLPFYNVYGGTQDNNTQGGPARTRSRHGITNEDWFITVGGDGFKPQVDPEDPNIVYSQYQYGGLRRFDRRDGSTINVAPQGDAGEALKWNWDAALMISPHAHTRLYYGANRLFRTDDRGDSWRPVSPDLTRQIDRNTLEVMGKVWSIDAVAKNRSTSFYGTIVSVTESPLEEGLLYVGCDDGMIQVSEDDGENWRSVESVLEIPKVAYVADLEASQHDPDTVFAVFNNHKMGDFKPYLARSTDRGASWTSITGDLPERGPLWAVAQDHEDPDLLFVGTEFGVFVTIDGGEAWFPLKSGLPVIAIRDIEIQRREDDLCLASFGRGFYVLDDYGPLRNLSEDLLEDEPALVFPVKPALMFVRSGRLGGGPKASQGASFFTAPNPPYGATFTWYLKEGVETLAGQRKKEEKKIAKEGGTLSYPSWDDLRAEEREEKPRIVLVISDTDDRPIREMAVSGSKGIHRATWNFTWPGPRPTSSGGSSSGPVVVPGMYRVHLAKQVGGVLTPLTSPEVFEVKALELGSLGAPDREAMLAFQRKVGRLQRAVLGASRAMGEAEERVKLVIKTLEDHPHLDRELGIRARALRTRLEDMQVAMNGDRTISSRNEPTPPSIMNRMGRATSGSWSSPPTATQKEAYELAADAFEPLLADLQQLLEEDLTAIEDALEEAGAPWTPGRVPRWKRE